MRLNDNLMMTSTFPEAKLLWMPNSVASLCAQLRRFERERGCRAVRVHASSIDFAEATRLATTLTLAVEVDEAVRAGHLVLVGSNHRQIVEEIER